MATELLGSTYYSSITSANFSQTDVSGAINGDTSDLPILSGTSPVASINNSVHDYVDNPVFTVTNVNPIDASGIAIYNDYNATSDGARDVIVRLYDSVGTLLGTETLTIPTTAYSGSITFTSGTTYQNVASWEFEVDTIYDGSDARDELLQIRELGLFGDLSPPVCFVAGTRIRMGDGSERAVEHLRIGDEILTKDGGPQSIRWIGFRKLRKKDLNEKLLPVRIRAGALGSGFPERELRVSQQHRILIRSKIIRRALCAPEALIKAKDLTGLEGVSIETTDDDLNYYHILLDDHHILFANGVEAETLYMGTMAAKFMSQEALAEIRMIFPDIEAIHSDTARQVLGGKRAINVVQRHMKNSVPVYIHS